MPAMGALFVALAGAVRAVVANVLGPVDQEAVGRSIADVHDRRGQCVRAASRRARMVLEQGEDVHDDALEGEWLGYTALLVQVDRIVGDLRAPLPS
jgi:hypothetical protein